MKYIFSILLCTAVSTMLLASCGGNSASQNNGSDTGVSRTTNDIMGNIERGVNDVTDGTVFDANGRHSNVDEYQGNGYSMSNKNSTSDNHNTNMAYGSSVPDSNMNY